MAYMDEQIINAIQNAERIKNKTSPDKTNLEMIIKQIREGIITLVEPHIKMERRTFLNDSFTISIPKEFDFMDDGMAKIKYPNESRPGIIFTNRQDTVNIGLNYVEQALEDEDVTAFRDVMKNAVISIHPSSKIMDTGDFNTDKHTVAYYTFPNHVIGGQMYNLFFALTINKKVLVCNLNCLKKDMDKWMPIFYGIMHTIQIDEKEGVING